MVGYSNITAAPLLVVFLAIFLGYLYIYLNKPGIKNVEGAMAQTGLLMVSNLAKAHHMLKRAAQHVNKTLYIGVNAAADSPLAVVSKQITNIYSNATSVCGELDVRLLLKSDSSRLSTGAPVQLVLLDSSQPEAQGVEAMVANLETGFKVLNLDTPNGVPLDLDSPTEVRTYSHVALGGTFDRLHNGHKILLSQAALRATERLIVGVTDIDMIKSKKLWELIEPLEERIRKLREFLEDIKPGIEYYLVPLHDIYGPTKDDARIKLLVVSEETARGGPKLNEKRAENGLPPMDVYTIELAQDVMLSQEEELKISSSNRRMRLLGTMLRPPRENPLIPKRPYILGLSGGIASGKTKITERLKGKGAAIVNCDYIAHDLYKPGMPLNATVAETFGSDIITDAGEVDRKRLGQIVFNNKNEMEKLNRMLWPAIQEEAHRRVRALGEQGYEVVVLEAAVMVQAGWQRHVHQLWAVIVPPEEAVKRLMERNSLSEEAAWERVRAQPSNSAQVAEANVVFSPFWSYEYTQAQVDKAWQELQTHLKTNS